MHPTSTVGVVTAPAAQTIGVILIPIGIMALRHHHRVDITTGILIAAALVLISWVILSVRASALLRAVTHTKSMQRVMFVTALWFGALVVPPLVLTRVVSQPPAWAVVAVWILPAFTVVLTTLA